MDRRERQSSLTDVLLASFDGQQKNIWTSLPAIIESVNFAAMTVTAQPTIQGVVRDKAGNLTNVNLPLLVDVPIQYPSGGGFTLTFPIKKGDECLITFSARCIDSWWQSGGIQVQAEQRMHDLSDGFANVGIRSQPNVISNISSTKVQLRSDDGLSYVELSNGHACNIVAPGGINLNGVTIDSAGNLVSPATITGTTDVVFAGKSSKIHTHFVPSTPGNTGIPL